jgi:hypothetical protein
VTRSQVRYKPYLSEKLSEKSIELISKKCDSAKEDLDKNWIYQIITLGVGLGLIYGLGGAISTKFLEEPGHEKLLYLIAPLINIYLFMRFGLLATHFSQTRFAMEDVVKGFCANEGIDIDNIDVKENGKLKEILSSLYITNSNFEHYHIRKLPSGVIVYLFFVPIVLGSGQGVSMYLLHLFSIPNFTLQVTLMAAYIAILAALYLAYFKANRKLYFIAKSKEIRHGAILIPLAIIVGAVVYWAVSATIPPTKT